MNVVIADERVGYYEIPGDGGRSLLDYLDNGFNVVVEAGPACRREYVYWYVNAGGHGTGWVLGQNMEPVQ
ncbi:MAG: hypothetical protein IPN96_07140 [Anaerolineales bacterium]|nr:hypothetical protein [Anaerolineales bacterium]